MVLTMLMSVHPTTASTLVSPTDRPTDQPTRHVSHQPASQLAGDLARRRDRCAGSKGVTVVVDYHQLGGQTRTVCRKRDGGKLASALFPSSGFALDYVPRDPGFVCRVHKKPSASACANTPPANAYWGLFWSNGKTGRWKYAALGVTSLRIPAGGSVAFSWQGNDQRTPPGVRPRRG
jgi:hypothetical protein